MPVLIVTGRSGWVERVNGLNAGADDYLEKPFQIQELVARLRALLRRSSGQIDPTIRYGDIELNAGMVRKDGRNIDLTAIELRILQYLMHRIAHIISKNELLDHIYSADEFRNPNTVEVYITRLRKKLGRSAIRTVRGVGYRIG